MDDIIITSTLSNVICSFISLLRNLFALKDLRPLHYFHGIEASWVVDGNIYLSQSKYIRDLLGRTNILDSKPQPSSMIFFFRLTQDVSTVVPNVTVYCSIVGALQYILIDLR